MYLTNEHSKYIDKTEMKSYCQKCLVNHEKSECWQFYELVTTYPVHVLKHHVYMLKDFISICVHC